MIVEENRSQGDAFVSNVVLGQHEDTCRRLKFSYVLIVRAQLFGK